MVELLDGAGVVFRALPVLDEAGGPPDRARRSARVGRTPRAPARPGPRQARHAGLWRRSDDRRGHPPRHPLFPQPDAGATQRDGPARADPVGRGRPGALRRRRSRREALRDPRRLGARLQYRRARRADRPGYVRGRRLFRRTGSDRWKTAFGGGGYCHAVSVLLAGPDRLLELTLAIPQRARRYPRRAQHAAA